MKLVEVGGLAVLAMGKRGNRSQSQLLGSLTKKQKKHLRDFGEEHPFYDRCGGAWRDPRCQPRLPEGPRVSRRWARARPGAVTGQKDFLLLALKKMKDTVSSKSARNLILPII